MNIGRRFKIYRKKNNLTQLEAAKYIGVKPYQLANYESNRSEPSLKVLINMSKTYRVSIDQLLGNTKNINEQEIGQFEMQQSEQKEFVDKLKALLKDFEDSHSH